MRIVLFVLGECIGLYQSVAHVLWLALGFCLLFAVLLFFRVFRLYSIYVLLFALGYVYVSWWCHAVHAKPLPLSWLKQPMEAWAEVVSIPKVMPHGGQQFEVRLIQVGGQELHRAAFVRVRWQGNYHIQVGSRYHGWLAFKPLRSLHNPGMHDQRQFSYAHGLIAQASVQKGTVWQLYQRDPWRTTLLRWRYHALLRLQALLPKTPGSVWLPALVLGFSEQLGQDDWRVLRDTGTAHLMAISGLHIALVAGFFSWLGHVIYYALPGLGLRWPKPMLSRTLGVVAAVGYSAMAGFSLSTRRCLMMLACYQGSLICGKKQKPWHALCWSLLFECVLHPVSLLSSGCWLSYGAVALIFYTHHGRCLPSSQWSKWCRMPVVMWLGMMPLLAYFFNQCSLTALLANMVAVPYVSFCVLPVSFLGWMLSHVSVFLASTLLHASVWLLEQLRQVLFYLDHGSWHGLVPSVHISFMAFVCAMVGVLLCFLPGGMPCKYVSLLWLLPCFFPKHDAIASGSFKLTVLDVGQGLASVVQTAHHSLVYDAGMKFGHVDMGEQVVLPYLSSQGVHAVDTLMISHGDNDHAGGAAAVASGVKVKRVFSSSSKVRAALGGSTCIAGQSWWWDGVYFEVLWPTTGGLNHGNNSSCVLRVSAGEHAVLLAGDVERSAELKMLQLRLLSGHLKADVLVVPHHGSKTSSSAAWLAKVQPRDVIFSTGLMNRYHFPHQEVLVRYQKLGVHTFNTAYTGAVTWYISPNYIDYGEVLGGRFFQPIWA